jgi:hypothetical protein
MGWPYWDSNLDTLRNTLTTGPVIPVPPVSRYPIFRADHLRNVEGRLKLLKSCAEKTPSPLSPLMQLPSNFNQILRKFSSTF